MGQSGTLNLSGTDLALTLLGKHCYYDYSLNVWLVRYQLTGKTLDGFLFGSPGSNGGLPIWAEDTGQSALAYQVNLNGQTLLGTPAVPETSTTVSFGLLLALGGVVIAAKRKKAAAS